MKRILNLEELAQLVLCIAGLYCLPMHIYWWLWPALFLAPDLSMMGYLVNTKVGAFCYNLAHHKGIAGVVILTGWFLSNPVLQLTGLLLWGHSSFDRLLGYGLKFPDSFKHTHLGVIGEKD